MAISLSINKIYKNWQLKYFKVSKGLSPEIVKGLIQFGEQMPYELRKRPQFAWIHSVFSDREAPNFLGRRYRH